MGRSMAGLDSLYRKVARRVLDSTLAVKKGEAVTVETWNNGLGFARIVVAEARARGCTATMVLEDEAAYIEGLTRAPSESVGKMGKNEYGLLAGTDAYIFIPGPLLAAYQTKLKPGLLSESTGYNSSWYDSAEKVRLRGARLTFGYIGEEMAGILGKTVRQISQKQLEAALADPAEISRSARDLLSSLSGEEEVVVSAGNAQLGLTAKGKPKAEDGVVSKEDIDSGENMTYMPPGFVACQVEPATTSGTVKVSPTLTRMGLLKDATLTFREGKLVSWASNSNKKMVDELVEVLPRERRLLTTLMVGFNPKMPYLYGQDRMVAGSVTLAGFGFTAVVRGADLSAGGGKILRAGRLS